MAYCDHDYLEELRAHHVPQSVRKMGVDEEEDTSTCWSGVSAVVVNAVESSPFVYLHSGTTFDSDHKFYSSD